MAVTELVLITGERLEISGSYAEVEAVIVGASRGAMLELACLTDAATGRTIGVNPAHVVALYARD